MVDNQFEKALDKKEVVEEYNVEKEIEKVCEKELISINQKCYAKIKGIDKLPLLLNELIKFSKEIIKEDVLLIDGVGVKVKREIEEVEKIEEIEDFDISEKMQECFRTIKEILKKYCDLEERYYPLIALWIIGTYAHDEFETFPYLFINATKGSGKTRLLKLIAELSNKGRILGSLTEAVLFRTAKGRTFCIDEFEQIGSKEKGALRELLNSAYKKGMIIERSAKKKGIDGESWEIEEFDVYTSVVMANIWGMENVLEDRCLTIILEKSDNKKIIKLIENFKKDKAIILMKETLEKIQNKLITSIAEREISLDWNIFVEGNTSKANTQELRLFKMIDDAGIDGRNLELFIPLYLLAYEIEESVLSEIIEISKDIIKEKNEEDYHENKDKILRRFLFKKFKDEVIEYSQFISITKITNEFKDYLGVENDDTNSRWMGKALKRMKLIKEKQRKRGGIVVLINSEKLKNCE